MAFPRPQIMRLVEFRNDSQFQGILLRATSELIQSLQIGTTGAENIEMNREIWCRLPHDLLIQIVAHLPTLTRWRFKNVCKQWQQLFLQENLFSQSVSSLVPARSFPAFIFGHSVMLEKFEHCLLLEPRSRCPVRRLILEFFEFRKVRILTACKSLICLCSNGYPISFYICNPVIKTWIELPRIQGFDRCDFVGMSFHIPTRVCTLLVGEMEFGNSTQIYDTASNGWVTLDLPVDLPVFPRGEGVYSRGKFYWVNKNTSHIVAFNVAERSWNVIELPRNSANTPRVTWQLTGSEGNVVLVCNKELKLWKLIEDELDYKWLELQTIPRSLCQEGFGNEYYPQIVVNSCGWVSVYLPGTKLALLDAEGRTIHSVNGGPLRGLEESCFTTFRPYELNNIWWPY
ncbi:hypothetical protein SUGI_0551430 [Cryptomeria japonica]|uniref:F-box only protein 6-like n=1 Tax=Cryptomeria japonica TaxID=3369 RepID=UPI002408EB79|nr:F-box only protein 6-like [Cryptomeria japonica]GLJ28086.1 hypothetical protein SUGI_0551430 [Cryptomeria japonica]